VADDEIPNFRDIPEADRKKAKAFFDRGATVAGTGQYDFAITMYLDGLGFDPESLESHQALRDISLRRKASGGKGLGMFEKMKVKTNSKDDKANMIAAEKLLAYDPGNVDVMITLMRSAQKAGFIETVNWIGPIAMRANVDSGKPDFKAFVAIKDIYIAIQNWKAAGEAAQAAAIMRPDDQDLINEMKNLGARHTMTAGKYGQGGNFTDSVKDKDTQQRLLDADKGIATDSIVARNLAEAEAEYKASPDEPGKITKFAEALLKTEKLENENKAIDLLAHAYDRTKQFRFRMQVGKIKLMQLSRADRGYRERITKSPSDEGLKQEYQQFLINRQEEELKEFTLCVDAYPTDLSFKYEAAKRLFFLQRYDEAIPQLQTARQDPKIRVDATIMLGRSFLEAQFLDEAVDTLRQLIEEYDLKGDARSKEMYYWYARGMEGTNEIPAAIKAYSQLAQWDFNFRDVQKRIKALRASLGPKPTQ
jgi:hypothetical protein